jgi:glycosyltransferase involved in cell wall biosynthesis
MSQKKKDKATITYFHRNKKVGFSINKVSQTYIREIEKKINIEQYFVPCYRADLISCLRNIWFVYIHRNKDGINHITGDIHYCMFALIGCKSILTIHDTCLLEYTKNKIKKIIFYIFWYKLPFGIAQKLICISENTKNEITKITKRKDIEVIYNAVDPAFNISPKIINKEKPIILQIGTSWNKNIKNIIVALSSICCHLRIIGLLSSEQKEEIKKNKIDYSIISNLSNKEILDEYIKSDIVCFCSIFEGFGMPIIEAQAIGRAVITSKINPLTEIAGNGALFVDPKNINDIRAGITEIIKNDDLRNKLIKNGCKNVNRFNSLKITQKYYELYKIY